MDGWTAGRLDQSGPISRPYRYQFAHLALHVISGTHPTTPLFFYCFTLTLLSSSVLSPHQSHSLSFVLDRSSLITSTARAKHFSFLSCRQTLASRPPQPSCPAMQRKAAAAPQFPLYHFSFRLRCALAESHRASFIQCGLQSCAEASTK